MAYIELVDGKYKGNRSVRDLIKYIMNPKKCPHQIWHPYATSDEDIDFTAEKFISVAEVYRKTSGKRMHHIFISFAPNEKFEYRQYLHIGYKLADYFGKEFQVVFALHEYDNNGKRVHPHIHMGINAINYNTGKRMDFNKAKLKAFRCYVSSIISWEQNRASN